MKGRRKSRCPLAVHVAPNGRACIGCGKSFRPNLAKKPARKARKTPRYRTLTNRAKTRPPVKEAQAHRGYSITKLISSGYAVSKDGFHISYAPTHAGAVAVVDMLTNAKSNPAGGARATGSPAPADSLRMGRLLKIFYQRDQGNRQGLYYHTFTKKPAIYRAVDKRSGRKMSWF